MPLFFFQFGGRAFLQPISNYNFTAHLHLFKWKELNILLDVNSGAIHILDDPAYELIDQMIQMQGDLNQAQKVLENKYPADDLNRMVQELTSLYLNRAIFTEPEPINVDFSTMKVKALCLNVAHLCNMRCQYCFAGQGLFGKEAGLMSIETAKAAVGFLIQNCGDIRNLEIDFFGGEPLLVFDMLTELVDYCRELEPVYDKRFHFTLTTNSLLLDKNIIDWVIDNRIAVILSLDGRKETNDKYRVLPNGNGTYEAILPKIKEIVAKKPVSYYIRGTFTRSNLDFSRDLNHLIELGFTHISIEPAVGSEQSYAILPEDLPVVLREYEKLTDVLLESFNKGNEIDFFHYNLNLQKGPCLAKRVSGCGAGIEYLVITPEGSIYPCHQFVGNSLFYMGNIFEGKLNYLVRQKFENNQLKNKKCQQCWARFYCGGGCHANAYLMNGDISQPYQVGCDMHKKRIERAIYLDLKKRLLAEKTG
ncbi:MAG: thioether cross-link-forming SCIFF peptide maturase [Syntrophomonadaceae bacterium]|nr:thioether cross-link-forming SCIFF peptide maturase [Syntrophomonadaceae bacterium]